MIAIERKIGAPARVDARSAAARGRVAIDPPNSQKFVTEASN